MEISWETCVFTMKKISEMCAWATKMFMPTVLAFIPTFVIIAVFDDKLHPYFYVAKYLELGYVSLFVPAYTCWAHSRIIRNLIRSIDDEQEHDDDPVLLIKPKPSTSCAEDSSIFCVLGINTLKISGKEWAKFLLILYALAVALFVAMMILLDDAHRKLLFARRLSMLYISVSSVALYPLQGIPMKRLERIYELKLKQKQQKKNSSSSSAPMETTAGLKQD